MNTVINLDDIRIARLNSRRTKIQSAIRRVMLAEENIERDVDELRKRLGIETALFSLGEGAGNEVINSIQDQLLGILDAGRQAKLATPFLKEWVETINQEIVKILRRQAHGTTNILRGE